MDQNGCRRSSRAGSGRPILEPVRKLLLPLDRTRRSREALPFALSAASPGSLLVLLQVIEPLPDLPPDPPNDHPDLAPRLEKARSLLGQLAADLTGKGYRVEFEVAYGHPADHIVEAVQRHQIEQVFMTTHSGPGPDAGLLGGVAEEVWRRSPCQVVLVRSGWPVPVGSRVAVAAA